MTQSRKRPSLDVACRGQVFTPEIVVEQMLALRRNRGRILEPSAGNGAFSRRLENCTAIELDAAIAPEGARVQDFFSYPDTEKFPTVIGNPPYVRYRDIERATKDLLRSEFFDCRSNLYLFFIEKAVRHLDPGGELIFIVPRDFIKLTTARKLNAQLFEFGTITHWAETGDKKIFRGVFPNCAIFRYERGNTSRETTWWILGDDNTQKRVFTETRGQLVFAKDELSVPLSSLFDVKVGAVSGADRIFTHPAGNRDFVCSSTRATGKTRRMIYNCPDFIDYLRAYKAELLNRKIQRFNESNWWKWGRAYPESALPRIYVNVKTRCQRPFFVHDCPAYDGTIFALFPKNPAMDIDRATALLNERVPWEELGFVVDGRFLFTQHSLETIRLPRIFTDLSKAR